MTSTLESFCLAIEKRTRKTRYRIAKNMGLAQTDYHKFRRSTGKRNLRKLIAHWRVSGLSGNEYLQLLAAHLDPPSPPKSS